MRRYCWRGRFAPAALRHPKRGPSQRMRRYVMPSALATTDAIDRCQVADQRLYPPASRPPMKPPPRATQVQTAARARQIRVRHDTRFPLCAATPARVFSLAAASQIWPSAAPAQTLCAVGSPEAYRSSRRPAAFADPMMTCFALAYFWRHLLCLERSCSIPPGLDAGTVARLPTT